MSECPKCQLALRSMYVLGEVNPEAAVDESYLNGFVAALSALYKVTDHGAYCDNRGAQKNGPMLRGKPPSRAPAPLPMCPRCGKMVSDPGPFVAPEVRDEVAIAKHSCKPDDAAATDEEDLPI